MNYGKPIIGTKYNRLTIIGERVYRLPLPTSRIKRVFVSARCECGVIKDYQLAYLKQGKTKSCGCYWREMSTTNGIHYTHGFTKHPLYKVWKGINARCTDIKNKNYGGRGITICEEWKNNFMAFYDWAMDNGWQKGLPIDRHPNRDGNYEPSNVRFVTQTENNRNSRDNVLNPVRAIVIRKLYSNGFTQHKIADLYSVGNSCIGRVIRNESWT